jgi:hypothetical protein
MHGIYAHRDVLADPDVRLGALRLAVRPDDVVCGRTAAWLLGVWQPPPGAVVPLEISRPIATRGDVVIGYSRRRLTLRSRVPDAVGDPISGLDRDVARTDELALTSPLRTCFDLMRERRLVEAVVVADAFLAAGIVDRVELAAYCAGRPRWPGVRGTRLAVSLARPGTRSPGESRLRMLLVLAGFEEPLVNVPVLDAHGRTVAVPDLQVRGCRWAWLEYDGAYHGDADQHAADLRRENQLAVESGGVPILRYDRHSLMATHREAVVAEVARAVGRRGPLVDMRPQDFLRPPGRLGW